MKKNTILILLISLLSCTKKEVEIIDLSGLNLTQIPDSVFTKIELKELYLGATEIVFYPPLSALSKQQVDIVKRALEPHVRVIIGIDEYFSLD